MENKEEDANTVKARIESNGLKARDLETQAQILEARVRLVAAQKKWQEISASQKRSRAERK